MAERVNPKHEYLSYWDLRSLIDRSEVATSEYTTLAEDFSSAGIILESHQQFGNKYYAQLKTLQAISESGLLTKLKELRSTHKDAIREVFIFPLPSFNPDWSPGHAADRLFVNLIPNSGYVLYEPLKSYGFEKANSDNSTLLMKPYQRSL